MQSLTSQRFETFWNQLTPSCTGKRLGIIGSEQPLNFDCLSHKHSCYFISNSKDSLREAKSLGFNISTVLNTCYDIIVLELTKSKETNLGLLALAEECLRERGEIIINGDNQVGVRNFLKNISTDWPAEITLIKKKGRIALYKKKKPIFCALEKISRFSYK